MHAIAWIFAPLLRLLLPASGRRDERRHQRHHRCALWLATQGVDIGPRRIHGMEVAPR